MQDRCSGDIPGPPPLRQIKRVWRAWLRWWRPRWKHRHGPLLYLLAYFWRRLMVRTTVIGITGSVGKSTAKDCLARILADVAPTVKTDKNFNTILGVVMTVLSIRPRHRFAVVEVGAAGPGTLAPAARLLKPDIAVVLSVAGTHTREYDSLDQIAVEKARLPASLSRGGTALFNADDPRVRSMAEEFDGRKVLFGEQCGSALTIREARAAWPDRLSFTVSDGTCEVPVQTQLIGTHWIPSLRSALAVAHHLGVGLEDAAKALACVPPMPARLQPVYLPSGAVVIRDEKNGAVTTLEAMLEVMRTARATRIGLVISDVSDSKAKPRKRARDFGSMAAEVADFAVFVNERGSRAVDVAVAGGMDPEHCHAQPNLKAAADCLKRELRPGDVVFFKGCTTDHLTRLVMAQFGEIACWRTDCRLTFLCDQCANLGPDFSLAVLSAPAGEAGRAPVGTA